MDIKGHSTFCVLIFLCGLAAADTRMAFSDLPAAVQKAAKSQIQGAQVLAASSEKEDGRTTYEVETKVDGKSRDLSFNASGQLLEVEQQVDLNSIPAAAKTSLLKSAGSGTIQKVESVTAGKSVSYEATVTTNTGHHTEIAVNADGTRHRD